jgi:alpha-L-fucosidase
MKKGVLFLILTCLSGQFAVLAAGTRYTPSKENLQAREWFQDAKFGLFIHWGVYSVLGRGEWVMEVEKIPAAEYEKLPPQFNPVKYDPAEWVRLAKQAGMKYITITSKHHDGFAMWDSAVSDWDIMNRTPYKKDVLKMLADECHKQGIKLFFYHSHLDWHHPDYFPRGRTGKHAGRPETGDFTRYLDYMNAQIAELCDGRYGNLAGVWFDGWWDQQVKEEGSPPTRTAIDWRLRETYDLIHRLQPQALIGNNHHVAPFEGEDFQMFEKDLPGHDTSGFNKDAQIGNLPLETCDTIGKAWGYNAGDKAYKSTRELIHYLVRAAGYNSNFLLNVGPRPDGTIQPEFVERLQEIGKWMAQYGESIYGTRGGPITPKEWGASTQKGNRIYVHLLDAKPGTLLCLENPVGMKVAGANLMKDGTEVKLTQGHHIILHVPETLDPINTVVVMDLVD